MGWRFFCLHWRDLRIFQQKIGTRKEPRAAVELAVLGNDAVLGVRCIVYFCHADWESLLTAILTLGKPAQVKESRRNGVLHGQRTFYPARATRTFPSNHRLRLLSVLI
jgi:hypothetical protein